MRKIKSVCAKSLLFFFAFVLLNNQGWAFNWSDNNNAGMDATGNALCIWQTAIGTTPQYSSIQAAYYDVGLGTWSSPVVLTSLSGNAYLPKLVMNNNGDAVAVWYNYTTSFVITLQAAIFTGGSWGPVQDITDPLIDLPLNFYDIDINDNGDIHATWDAFIDTTYTAVVRATYTTASTGTWTTPVTISN